MSSDSVNISHMQAIMYQMRYYVDIEQQGTITKYLHVTLTGTTCDKRDMVPTRPSMYTMTQLYAFNTLQEPWIQYVERLSIQTFFGGARNGDTIQTFNVLLKLIYMSDRTHASEQPRKAFIITTT